MPSDDVAPNGHVEETRHPSEEEGRFFLRNSLDDADDLAELRSMPAPTIRPQVQRQSSLSQPRPSGTPRTTNRVRFDVEEHANVVLQQSEDWMDDEDYLHSPRPDAPLLTDITPPLDSPFLSDAFQPEEHLPNARPKSSMRSAIMNMANSIIGAGIIGQPYAFRQAGLTMGVILLVGLTITVDWTIRLIVINSKLSGADSFRATM